MIDLNAMKNSLIELEEKAQEKDKIRDDAWIMAYDLKKAIWLLENNLEIGDTVEILDGRKWIKGRIMGMDIQYQEAIPVVLPFKKDGSVGQRRIFISYKPDIRKVPVQKDSQ